ncbi:STAG3 protein, partial [Rostratula benghalensis]|nr:STAG3 protein [Rostratula benghalensis]
QEQLQSLKSKVTSFFSWCLICLSDMDAGVRETVWRGWGGRADRGDRLALSVSLCPQAFTVLSDLLLVFGPQLPRDGREALAPLVLQPDADLQSQMAAFLMDHVFYDTGGQEELSGTGMSLPCVPGVAAGMSVPPPHTHTVLAEDTERHIVDLDQRRVFLAGFCKLIIYNVLELSAASDIFKHYVKFYSDYGDIIKETLDCTRKMDLQAWARTLLLSLKQLMTELLLQEGPKIRNTKRFQEIQDLARRFSLLFSFHQLQNRRVLLNLHKEGIEFAFQDPSSREMGVPPLNLTFLEVLSEFSPRLLQPDKA